MVVPSEYIFQTQIENLKATGAELPDNIVYLTYAKPMNMDEESIQAINTSREVWDEFHRGGADPDGKIGESTTRRRR